MKREPQKKTRQTTYHINPQGNDRAEGTASAPLRTLGRALKKAAAATQPAELVLQPGVYPPLSLSDVRGVTGRPLVIRGLNPLPIDFSVTAQLEGNRMEWRPAREALDRGVWQLRAADGLAIIEGTGSDGSELCDCSDLRLEHLAFFNGRTAVALRRCERVTVADCVITGEPAHAVHGIAFRVGGAEDQPSRGIRLERVLAYNLKECGFTVQPGALFDSCWEACIAHGMQSSGGDGFSFSHVVPNDKPGSHPNRKQAAFPNGVDYRITLRRCLALRNRLDGFDLGQGVGGITLEMCLGDGNGWGEWHSKDLKVWSSNNRLIQSRMTGRTLFVKGVTEMREFMAGTFDVRVGYGRNSGSEFADEVRRAVRQR
jgi:hypothetical protein